MMERYVIRYENMNCFENVEGYEVKRAQRTTTNQGDVTMEKIAKRVTQALTTLIVLGFVVTITGRTCAASATQVATDLAVQQVYESMKSINDALTASVKKNPAENPWDAFSQLVTNGFMSGPPPVPNDIGDGSGEFGSGDFGAWSARNVKIGGCGLKNIGAPKEFYIQLGYVNDDFCKAYNKAQGLDAAIPLNCFTKPDEACKASGSGNGGQPVDVGKKSFCFKTSDLVNRIYFATGLDPQVPCAE